MYFIKLSEMFHEDLFHFWNEVEYICSRCRCVSPAKLSIVCE